MKSDQHRYITGMNRIAPRTEKEVTYNLRSNGKEKNLV
jgi:hypothetical protein